MLLGALCAFIIEGGAWIDYNPIYDPVPPAANGTVMQWTYGNCIYQSIEIITAVNYGDFIPTTANGKAFVCVYVVVCALSFFFVPPLC